jgi:hypothetical protein
MRHGRAPQTERKTAVSLKTSAKQPGTDNGRLPTTKQPGTNEGEAAVPPSTENDNLWWRVRRTAVTIRSQQ